MVVRFGFLFSGRVQGVGFRFTARGIATQLGLTGFVRNLPDGRVHMEAQGEESDILQMIDALTAGDSYIRITDIEKKELPPQPGEYSFEYRF